MARKKPELLLPASSLEVLRTAVNFGADAVYIGGEAFSLRAKAKNFSLPEMAEGIAYAHAHGVKVYVTANILAHDEDLDEAAAYFEALRDLRAACGRTGAAAASGEKAGMGQGDGNRAAAEVAAAAADGVTASGMSGEETGQQVIRPDALLIADPGMFELAGRACPEIERHISTQANNVNAGTFRFWHRLGAARVVCGRELSLREIKRIRAQIPEELEIEAFVHGAMCISYSGRCLLSNFLAGRDANRGACAHPCRWKYSVVEETRPGEYLPVFENERGTFIFNSKDLCMIDHLPDLIDAGIDSLKIEGRMKTALYVATVARAYRKAIDDYCEDPVRYEANLTWYRQQVMSGTYRNFTTGFFYGKPTEESQIYDSNTYEKTSVYLGCVEALEPQGGRVYVCLTQKNKFSVGETIEIMRPDGEDRACRVLAILDEEGHAQESAPHPQQALRVLLSAEACVGDLLRRPADAVR